MDSKNKWGIAIDSNYGAFLLGANINIGKSNNDWHCYVCVYLGFKTLVVGRDVFPSKED